VTDSEFEALSEAAIAAIERAVEASAVDADVETKGAGVLQLEFADGARIVVNRHSAAREIWVAAPSGGFHFRYDGSRWRDTRNGPDLFTALSQLVQAHGGVPLVFGDRS
jgi:CyaY protein